MNESRMARGLRACLWVVGVMLVASCGGGGGDSPGNTDAAVLEWTTTSPVQIRTLAGVSVQVNLKGRLNGLLDGESVSVRALETGSSLLVSDLTFLGDNEDVSLNVLFADDLPVGTRVTDIELGICTDAQCTASRPGSTRTMRIAVTVDPNITLPAALEMSRSGAEPAVEPVVAYTAPPAAGLITAQLRSGSDAIAIQSEADGQIRLIGRQVRAGTYLATLHLSGSSDPLYRAEMPITYVVSAPVEGERELAITPSFVALTLSRGEVVTQRLSVTWPTFTSDRHGPVIAGCDATAYTLTAIDTSHWDLRIAATPEAADYSSCSLRLDAGDRSVSTSVDTRIDPSLSVELPAGVEITPSSTAADLRRTLPVHLVDGTALPWTASTTSPWLRLLRSSGTTGADPLVIEADPAHVQAMVDANILQASAEVQVVVDRTTRVTQTVRYDLAIRSPFATRVWPGALVGSRGRLYLEIAPGSSPPLDTLLRVTGARVSASRTVSDALMLTDIRVLQLDLDGAVPGQSVRLSNTTALFTASHDIPVLADTALPAAFQALPHAQRRPPSHSPLQQALYWAEPGWATRWAWSAGSGWQLRQQALPGLIDTDPRPDEQRLVATVSDALLELDPVTLATQQRTGIAELQFIPANPLTWWSAPDWRSKALTHLSDGRAWMEISLDGGASPIGLAPIKLNRINTSQALGTSAGQAQHTSASAGRRVLAFSQWSASSPSRATWSRIAGDEMALGSADIGLGSMSVVALSDARVIAVSDDGHTQISADGTLWLDGRFPVALSAALPAGHRAGGWALGADGQHALAYSYRLDTAGAVASQPQLHVLTLRGLNWAIGAVPSRIATIDLPGLPGCASPRASGETCVHSAHVLVTRSGRNAFVLGPRGIAVVELPASVGEQVAVPLRSGGVGRAQSVQRTGTVSVPAAQRR